MKTCIPLVFAFLLVSAPLTAQWTSSPEDNSQLTEIEGQERHRGLLSDGDGGWFALYDHSIDNDSDVYVMRLDADGNILWTTAVAASDEAHERNSAMVGDGAGGVIIIWIDNRVGNSTETYAQRVDADGRLQWAAGGVTVSPVSGDEEPGEESVCPKIVAGNNGGAIVTFVDDRVLGLEQGIYAQYLNADGSLGSLQYVGWLSNPASCTDADYDISSDGAGGIYVIFEFANITAQENELRGAHLDATGQRLWPEEEVEYVPTVIVKVGMRVHASPHSLNNARLISDASGGVIAIWLDNPGLSDPDTEQHTRGQRINSSGDLQWGDGGKMLNTKDETSPPVEAVIDDQDNLFFTFHDDDAYFIQKVGPDGTALWNDGIEFRNQTAGIVPPLVMTSCGDVIVAYSWSIDAAPHIYTSRIDTDGQFVWEQNTLRISSLMGDQVRPTIAIDADDKCVVAWVDSRGFGSSSTEWNLYAQGFGKDGQIGTITSVNDVASAKMLTLAPSPAADFTRISLPSLQRAAQLQVFNSRGRLIWQELVPAGMVEVKLLTHSWPAGVYMVHVAGVQVSGAQSRISGEASNTISQLYRAKIVVTR